MGRITGNGNSRLLQVFGVVKDTSLQIQQEKVHKLLIFPDDCALLHAKKSSFKTDRRRIQDRPATSTMDHPGLVAVLPPCSDMN